MERYHRLIRITFPHFFLPPSRQIAHQDESLSTLRPYYSSSHRERERESNRVREVSPRRIKSMSKIYLWRNFSFILSAYVRVHVSITSSRGREKEKGQTGFRLSAYVYMESLFLFANPKSRPIKIAKNVTFLCKYRFSFSIH